MKIALDYLLVFSHFWFATPQLVLQADWQEVWHSPQPPFLALSHRLRVSRVLILSIMTCISDLLNSNGFPADYPQTVTLKAGKILTHHPHKVKLFRRSSVPNLAFWARPHPFCGSWRRSSCPCPTLSGTGTPCETARKTRRRAQRLQKGGKNMMRSTIIAGRMRKPVV